MRTHRMSIAVAVVVSVLLPSSFEMKAAEQAQLEQATFGLGCYSCAEAIFERLKGVESIVVGYSGGNLKNPTDEQIGSGLTGHAEVVQIKYNPRPFPTTSCLKFFGKCTIRRRSIGKAQTSVLNIVRLFSITPTDNAS